MSYDDDTALGNALRAAPLRMWNHGLTLFNATPPNIVDDYIDYGIASSFSPSLLIGPTIAFLIGVFLYLDVLALGWCCCIKRVRTCCPTEPCKCCRHFQSCWTPRVKIGVGLFAIAAWVTLTAVAFSYIIATKEVADDVVQLGRDVSIYKDTVVNTTQALHAATLQTNAAFDDVLSRNLSRIDPDLVADLESGSDESLAASQAAGQASGAADIDFDFNGNLDSAQDYIDRYYPYPYNSALALVFLVVLLAIAAGLRWRQNFQQPPAKEDSTEARVYDCCLCSCGHVFFWMIVGIAVVGSVMFVVPFVASHICSQPYDVLDEGISTTQGVARHYSRCENATGGEINANLDIVQTRLASTIDTVDQFVDATVDYDDLHGPALALQRNVTLTSDSIPPVRSAVSCSHSHALIERGLELVCGDMNEAFFATGLCFLLFSILAALSFIAVQTRCCTCGAFNPATGTSTAVAAQTWYQRTPASD